MGKIIFIIVISLKSDEVLQRIININYKIRFVLKKIRKLYRNYAKIANFPKK